MDSCERSVRSNITHQSGKQLLASASVTFFTPDFSTRVLPPVSLQLREAQTQVRSNAYRLSVPLSDAPLTCHSPDSLFLFLKNEMQIFIADCCRVLSLFCSATSATQRVCRRKMKRFTSSLPLPLWYVIPSQTPATSAAVAERPPVIVAVIANNTHDASLFHLCSALLTIAFNSVRPLCARWTLTHESWLVPSTTMRSKPSPCKVSLSVQLLLALPLSPAHARAVSHRILRIRCDVRSASATAGVV